ncbi:SNF2 family N-terminal domain-containing protein [Mrakia frigida]|uniref:SNF2 family N-terminal domain-containing protein n=1 Tax=Mrakia frigida TaxID=29902 RepID=UPI003FCC14C6
MSGGYNPAIKKKFVSPFISQNPSTPSSSSSNTKGTPANKRKLEGPAPPQPHAGPSRPSAVKKEVLSGAVRSYNTTPLIKRNVFYGVAQAAEEAGQGGDVVDEYWMVQWRKPQQKKHKTWDGDAILTIRGAKCFLKDTDGKDIAQGRFSAGSVKSGDELKVGGKEIEIDCPIEPKDYLSGACFGGNVPASASKPLMATSAPRIPINNFKPMIPSRPVAYAPKPPEVQFQPPPEPYYADPEPPRRVKPEPTSSPPLPPPQRKLKPPPPPVDLDAFDEDDFPAEEEQQQQQPEAGPSAPAPAKFKPMVPSFARAQSSGKGAEESPLKRAKTVPTTLPRFDPKRLGAVVMKRPSKDHQSKFNPKNYDLVDVVIDPILSDKMRPHQKEGFMYECVMALRKVEGTGAILADEMGLGKTLQTIALIWTLLKQSPYVGPHHQSVIGKALIVCPVSLTTNWKKEFNKWLGRDTIGIMVGDGNKDQIKQFTTSRRHQVLIIGYEKLRTVIGELKSCVPQIGLIVCDEGHRLKSKDAKTSKMFDVLSTKKRIILSGTPLQNDLGEFWAMVNFINPGILDAYSTFTKIYEKPIIRSRDPQCSKGELELGQARGAKLSEIGTQFILRRTADILSKFLPPKHEYVVFVAPTTLQLDIFAKLLHPSTLNSLTPQSLMMIDLCRKICNSPFLFRKNPENKSEDLPPIVAARALLPDDLIAGDMSCSGKMIAVANLLRVIRTTTQEKVVLVSNFTSTLDILEAHCKDEKYRYERLDGKTPQAKRQEMVDRFNGTPQAAKFIFLLSSKSGGAGLNLIGASRLIMFDSDWNPSTDAQAMARIHRDATGTIDESILQRQITKLGLSSSVMNHDPDSETGPTSNSFTPEELRNLFTMRTSTGCYTHDLLGCDCLFEDLDESLDDDAPKPGFPKSALVDLSDDSSENETSYITSASNVRTENPAKKARKAAKLKANKLAALKEFTHVDCLDGGLTNMVKDDILKAIVRRASRKKTKPSESSSTVASSPPPRGPPPSQMPGKTKKIVEDSDDSDEYESVINSDEEGGEDESSTKDQLDEEEDASDEPLALAPPAKRKSILDRLDFEDIFSSKEDGRRDEDAMDVDDEALNEDDDDVEEEEGGKKKKSSAQEEFGGTDLRKLAEAGQGGRVCFLFERVAEVMVEP